MVTGRDKIFRPIFGRQTKMNTKIISVKFHGSIKTYRSENGQHYFIFEFSYNGNYFVINCQKRPSLNGRDPSVENTHLYKSNNICFIEGKEPRTLSEAQSRAKEWAEYFLEYRRTGKTQR